MPTATLLIVDNDELFADSLRDALIDLGYGVIGTAATGSAAIKQTKQKAPDLVLMDFNLDGEMNGLQAAKSINGRFNVPVVFVTGVMNEQLLAAVGESPSLFYLNKSECCTSLNGTIETALRTQR